MRMAWLSIMCDLMRACRYWSSVFGFTVPSCHVAGNFYMVQIFAFFMDCSATAKIRTAKLEH